MRTNTGCTALLADPLLPKSIKRCPTSTAPEKSSEHLLKTLAGTERKRFVLGCTPECQDLERAAPLTTSLVAEHGCPDETLVATEKADAAVRMLVGLSRMHHVPRRGDEPPMAAFSRGREFAQSAERLRPGWYHRWMDDLAHHTINPNAPLRRPGHGQSSSARHLGRQRHGTVDAIAAWLANAPSPASLMNTILMTRMNTTRRISPHHGKRNRSVKMCGGTATKS